MTSGFHTIVYFPYEGAVITEHKTKHDALKSHKDNLTKVGDDYMGAALVSIVVIDEQGEWRDCNE